MSILKPNGELIPVGGGDNIPLLRVKLTVGRRESCDVEMNFPNISSLHCELIFREGYSDQTGELWSPSGRLLATTCQVAFYRT